MANTQTTLQFCIRKKPHADFYPPKTNLIDKIPDVTSSEKEKQPDKHVYVPRVKKLMELDSGDENIDLTNLKVTQKKLKRKFVKISQISDDDSSDSDCSRPKIAYTKKTLKYKSKNSTNADNSSKYENDDVENSAADVTSCSTQAENFKSLPGREPELGKLTSFLNDHLKHQNSGSLYISGPPGTGKTACLMNILERPEFKKGFTEVYINCTTMKSAGSIFNRICQELRIKATSSTEKASLTAIDKHLNGKHNMILLVLDEIDQLVNKKQSVLYTVFEWPLRTRSKMVLVGIANALDLTDRVLPRLHARPDLQLELMHFLPYTKQQIIDIFTAKLKEEMTTDLFSPMAIQMLAGKVAAISGDIRRALDIGKRVIDLASPKSYSNKVPNKMDKNCAVELKQVMSVLNDVYGTSQRLDIDVDDTFPLQQKILICSLMLILTKGNNKNITLGKLHDVYKRVCKRRNILAVDSTEFVGLCSLVETRGIIKLSGKKEPRMHKVVLQWDEGEVTNALSDKKMISDILSDMDCLT